MIAYFIKTTSQRVMSLGIQISWESVQKEYWNWLEPVIDSHSGNFKGKDRTALWRLHWSVGIKECAVRKLKVTLTLIMIGWSWIFSLVSLALQYTWSNHHTYSPVSHASQAHAQHEPFLFIHIGVELNNLQSSELSIKGMIILIIPWTLKRYLITHPQKTRI